MGPLRDASDKKIRELYDEIRIELIMMDTSPIGSVKPAYLFQDTVQLLNSMMDNDGKYTVMQMLKDDMGIASEYNISEKKFLQSINQNEGITFALNTLKGMIINQPIRSHGGSIRNKRIRRQKTKRRMRTSRRRRASRIRRR